MELRIISPSDNGFLKTIEWNHEDIKAEVAAKMQEYAGLVYTEESIKTAKEDRAALNKFKNALEDKRKEIKKQCLAPYEAFERQIKEIITLVDKPITLIGSQIKEVEDQKKLEKQNQIMEFYEKNVGALKGILPFSRVLRPEYLNASPSMKSIKEEIQQLFDRVNGDLDTIDQLQTTHELQVKDVYIRTLDLSEALRENARLEEVAKRIEERRARAASDREAANKAVEAKPSGTTAPVPAQQKPSAPVAEERYTVEFRVSGTKEQIDLLKEFLKINGIKYGPAGKEIA